jgi:serine/threonine protein kinase
MPLSQGDLLGRYEILAPLGAGGMGEVYRARDERLDRDVAIKVLPEDVANNPDRLSRFEREAKAVARLSHPNILEIHELGEQQGRPFMVTEVLEGETLRAILDRGGLTASKNLEYAQAIEVRDGDLFMTKVWPVWDPIRDDPRFVRLLDRLNLSDD